MPKFYTSVILLINQSKEICEKQFSVLGSEGGQISPLMHVPQRYDVLWILNVTALLSTQNKCLNMTNKKILTIFLLSGHMHTMLFRVLRFNHTSIIFILIYIFFLWTFFCLPESIY